MTDDLFVLEKVSWMGISGDWYNASNWSNGKVPTSQDIVTIESNNKTIQITFSKGNPTVGGINLKATNGGTLDLSGLTQLKGNSSENIIIEASGSNSKIDLSDLTTLAGGTNGTSLQFKANNRGLIDLKNLSQITGGTTEFIANGITSLIDLSKLTKFTDNAFDRSLIEVVNAGVVKVDNLQEATEVDIRSNNSYIALAKLETINGDNVIEAINGGQVGLPALRNINERILQIRSVNSGSNVLVSPSLNSTLYRVDLISGGKLVLSDKLSDINYKPVVNKNISNQNATEDAGFSFTFDSDTFLDIDSNNKLTYSATLTDGSALPSWLSFNVNNRTFGGTPRNENVGSTNIRVTATDPAGTTATRDFTLTVANTNDAPTLSNPLSDQTITVAQAFSYTLPNNTFTDIDVGDVLTYSATLSNNNALPAWLSFNGNNRTFSGTPSDNDAGILNIKVTATDQSGASVLDIFDLWVDDGPDAPLVDNTIPSQTATEDKAFSFTFAQNTFSDPDFGDSLTYSASLASGSSLPTWLSFNGNNRIFSGTPGNSDVGTVSLVVVATDTTGLQVSTTFDLSVANVNDTPQRIEDLPNQSATENQLFTYQIATTAFSDIDGGDSLTYSATLKNGNTLPSWLSFDAASRTFSGTPTPTDLTTLEIIVTVTDTAGAKADGTFSLTIQDVNNAPVVVNPIAAQIATEGSQFSFQIPANTFNDPDPGDTLTYNLVLADGGSLPTWLNFNSQSRTLSGTPMNTDVGTLDLVAFATDPFNSFIFSSFTLTVLNINNSPLLTTPLPDQLWSEGLTLSYTIPTNTFTDIDVGETLTYSATLADGLSLPTWLSFNPSTKTFSGTPTAGLANSSYDILVRVTDAAGETAQDIFTIPVTSAFDPSQYGATHLDLVDVLGYDLTALTNHFVNFGRFEGRSVDNFDELRYEASNPDLITVYGYNPAAVTEHFINFGRFEERPLNSFDPDQYLASNPDLLTFYGNVPQNGLVHYVAYGYNEGRSANNFDELRYIASNKDLISIFGTNGAAATSHYLAYGFIEGRDPLSFNAAEYIAGYQDLITAFGYNLDVATQHYLEYGYAEGRTDDLFKSDIYIASHEDLITALGYDLDLGGQHYILYGASEGREKDLFDPQAYLDNYADLQAVFGNNLQAATQHYIQYGYFEGRTDV